MSPRRPPKRRGSVPRPLVTDPHEEWQGEDYVVRRVAGAGAAKTYRCPGCDHEIPPGTPHVVTYPADHPAGPEERRHWHTPCWRARDRRGPRR